MQGWGYTVFGKVIGGLDTVDQISRVQTGSRGGLENVPAETVLIESATALPEN